MTSILFFVVAPVECDELIASLVVSSFYYDLLLVFFHDFVIAMVKLDVHIIETSTTRINPEE